MWPALRPCGAAGSSNVPRFLRAILHIDTVGISQPGARGYVENIGRPWRWCYNSSTWSGADVTYVVLYYGPAPSLMLRPVPYSPDQQRHAD